MYRDFKLDRWEDFTDCIQGKKLYIWGAGAKGREIANWTKGFALRRNIEGFIDSDLTKTECGGYPVYAPHVLEDTDKESCVVLISTDKLGLIAPTLEKMGVKYYFSYFWLNTEMRDIMQQNVRKDIVKRLERLLSDERSKEILHRIVEKRSVGFLDYTDIQEGESEYFCDEFFSPTEGEVFIDAGAFDGDTIEGFVDWTKNRYEKIYSFEPDVRMAEKIEKKMHRWHDVELIKKGLWSNLTKLPFVVDNKVYSSHLQIYRGGLNL